MINDLVIYVEIWAEMKVFIPQKDQLSAAERYISMLDTTLVDFSLINSNDMENEDYYGVCEVFDEVLFEYCQEHGYINDSSDDEEIEEYDE